MTVTATTTLDSAHSLAERIQEVRLMRAEAEVLIEATGFLGTFEAMVECIELAEQVFDLDAELKQLHARVTPSSWRDDAGVWHTIENHTYRALWSHWAVRELKSA